MLNENENTQSTRLGDNISNGTRIVLITISTLAVILIVAIITLTMINNSRKNVVELKLAETGQIQDWDITVLDFWKSLGDKENTQIINSRIKVKNNSTKSAYFLGEFLISNGDVDITLICKVDDKEYKYNPSFSSNNELYGSILPLAEKQDTLSFSIPDSISINECELFIKITENSNNFKNVLLWELKNDRT